MGEDESTHFITELTAAQPKMRAYIAKLVANASVTDDILQESNRVLWEKREQWEEGTVFLKWAYRVCYFSVQSWRRDTSRERLVFSDDLLEKLAAQEPAEPSLSLREEGLKRCLKKLSREKYQLVMKYYDPSLPLIDLAKERSLSPNTMAQQVRRIRQSLHRCIQSQLAKV